MTGSSTDNADGSVCKTSEIDLLTVEWAFRGIGDVILDGAGGLQFPDVSAQPGIYRFTLTADEESVVYIGGAELLKRRFQHYRTPGPTQSTNERINERIRAVLAAGGAVAVEIAVSASEVTPTGERVRLDLSRKPERALIEAAALLVARRYGTVILNL